MTGIEDRIAGVLREALSLGDFDGDQLYEGAIDPRELAAAVVAELGLRREWLMPLFRRFFGWKFRWATEWEKAE